MAKFFSICLYLLFFVSVNAQTIIQRDPEIEKMISEVSKDSLESYLKKLVDFGTRNTLSSQTNKNRGIGAARNWVLSKFQQFVTASSGRLTAFIDTVTIKPDGRRVNRAVLLGNEIKKRSLLIFCIEASCG